MATDPIFDVAGPILMEASFNGGTNWLVLGRSPNDDRPRMDTRPMLEELGTDEVGDEVSEAVYTGMTCLVMLTVKKVVIETLDILMARMAPGADTPVKGEGGIVGTRVVADGWTFALRLTPVLGDKIQKTFWNCYIPSDGILEHEMGNTATLRSFAVKVIRGSEGVFYTEELTDQPT